VKRTDSRKAAQEEIMNKRRINEVRNVHIMNTMDKTFVILNALKYSVNINRSPRKRQPVDDRLVPSSNQLVRHFDKKSFAPSMKRDTVMMAKGYLHRRFPKQKQS
jgi:hypothetical protein